MSDLATRIQRAVGQRPLEAKTEHTGATVTTRVTFACETEATLEDISMMVEASLGETYFTTEWDRDEKTVVIAVCTY